MSDGVYLYIAFAIGCAFGWTVGMRVGFKDGCQNGIALTLNAAQDWARSVRQHPSVVSRGTEHALNEYETARSSDG